MDFMNLPTSQDDSGNKYDSLYVVCYTLSKMVHLMPTTKNVKAQQLARLYYDNVYRLLSQHTKPVPFTGVFYQSLPQLLMRATLGTRLHEFGDRPEKPRHSQGINSSNPLALRIFFRHSTLCSPVKTQYNKLKGGGKGKMEKDMSGKKLDVDWKEESSDDEDWQRSGMKVEG